MARHILLFAALLLSLAVLAGCGTSDESPGTTLSTFKGGTQGIVPQFEPFGVADAGTFTIFDTETFPVEVLIRNKGESDVAAGAATVRLKGINLADFEHIAAEQLTNARLIEKVSDLNQNGGEELIDFTPGSSDARYLRPVTSFFEPEILGVVEYDYTTRLIIPQVCFSEDVNDKSLCMVVEAKQFFVSGAPITVRSVTEDVAGRGIVALSITIENAGGGRVTLPGESFDPTRSRVRFAMKTNPDSWECRSTGSENEARLTGGKATITCRLRQQLEKGTLFKAQVELDLVYRYESTIRQKLRIQESLS